MPKPLIFGISAFIFLSCIQTVLLPPDQSSGKVDLPFHIEEIHMVDDRGELLPMGWDMPAISIKSKSWKGNPEFTEEQKSDLERVIIRASNTAGEKAIATFHLEEGECNIAADWKSNQQFVTYKGKIVLEIPNRDLTYTGWAEYTCDLQNSKANEKHIMNAYDISARNVTYMILKQIKDQIKD